MPIKKGGKSIVLDEHILASVEARQKQEGFVGSLTSYVETILNQVVLGNFMKVETAVGRKGIFEAKMRLLELMQFFKQLESSSSEQLPKVVTRVEHGEPLKALEKGHSERLRSNRTRESDRRKSA